MSGPELLQDLLVIFAVAVVVVALLRRVGVPPIAGFIVVGALIGPRALGLVGNVHAVEGLAEVGVILLLFGIGLDLSLDRLRRLWRPILVGGALQVGITLAATSAVVLAFGRPMGEAVFVGCLVSVSSTAIVLRGLDARGELEAPHGRLTLGILVFQDLCVVPMVLVVPLLAGAAPSGGAAVIALLKAAGILAAVLVAARLLVGRLLLLIARTRQRELFLLAVLVVCLGTAWLASTAGVSLALGAFLAGLVVAGSEYRHQALADLIPFREVFSSLFFVSVGMLLVPAVLWSQAALVLGLLAAILVGKFAVVLLVGAIMRFPWRVWILAGAALAQVGEFSFVLFRVAQPHGLVGPSLAEPLLSAVILSMLVTPLALAAAPHVAAGMGRLRSVTRFLEVRTPSEAVEEEGQAPHDHVLIAGFGLAGEELARSLRESGISYVIIDLNADRVRWLAQRGEPALFGDVTSPEVLEALGVREAHELVIAINDADAAARAVRSARSLAPQLPILVRARYLADVEALREAGATSVVAGELEAAVEIAGRVLRRHGVAPSEVQMHVARVRARAEPPAQPPR